MSLVQVDAKVYLIMQGTIYGYRSCINLRRLLLKWPAPFLYIARDSLK